jgi:predicted PurR-regulated permease PerM
MLIVCGVQYCPLFLAVHNMNTSRPVWSGQTKLMVILVILAASAYLLSKFRVAITPVILGCILAYVLTPSVNFIERRLHTKRWLAIIIVYLLLLLLIAGILMVLIPTFVNQARRIDFDLDEILTNAKSIFNGQIILLGVTVDLYSIYTGLSGFLQGLIQPAVGRMLTTAASFLSSLVWVIFTFVISFYLIKDSQALNSWIEGLAPPGYKEDYIRLRDEIKVIWSAFFRGQILLAGVVAIIQTVVCLLLGLRFGLFLGLLAGLLEFVPSLGHTLWFILAGITAIFGGSTWLPLQNWVILIILGGVDVIFSQFDLNYLIPRIVGRSLRLPPLVVILGIVFGAAVAGVIGVLLASPTVASLRVLGRYTYARIFDLDPLLQDITHPALPIVRPYWRQKHAAKPDQGG